MSNEREELPEPPDDDFDFTPDLARQIIAKYQELLRAGFATAPPSPITEKMVRAGAAGMCCQAQTLGCDAQNSANEFSVCMMDTFMVDARRCLVAALSIPAAAPPSEPVAWQYRVMRDKGSKWENEWCEWRNAGKKYYDKAFADIAAGATRVEVRALAVVSRQNQRATERTEGSQS